jgi:hypothetical protein
MSAAAAAVDLAEPPAQQARAGGAALSDAFEFASHRGQAGPARTALARRLVGQVADHPGSLGEPAGAGGQRGDQPGPEIGETAAVRTVTRTRSRRAPLGAVWRQNLQRVTGTSVHAPAAAGGRGNAALAG